MERLTFFENGRWWANVDGVRTEGDPVDRLAAYEDSGLTPEECAAYGKADREGRYIVLRDAEEEGVARLREIALADKDGRVMVLLAGVEPVVRCKDCRNLRQIFDALALALRDPAVMGAKGVLGAAKVKALCKRVQEIVYEFSDAWCPVPERDYQQDRLDRALKDVFGEELQPFKQRYPFMKEQKY